MLKFKLRKISIQEIFRIIAFALCLIILILAPIITTIDNKNASGEDDITVMTLWQIDSFEGGKGSRADFLQKVADRIFKDKSCYIKVTALTADAARLNLSEGNIPDIISYGAGMFGIENFICDETPYYTWCRGGYCILSISDNADFSDCSKDNTIINGGTDNLSYAAAIFCGLKDAKVDKPTGAYVQLVNGKYKYLLGTQRDIFRLKSRGVAFKLKPITEFNDLYQNISIFTKETKKYNYAKKFINCLLSENNEISNLGLFFDGIKIYDDELSQMEDVQFTYKLKTPLSEDIKKEVDNAILNCDENKLKKLFK